MTSSRLLPPSRRALWFALLSLAASLSALPLKASAQDGITDLGTLGGTFSSGDGVSANGTVVVGTSTIAVNTYRAYRWTSSGMVNLGTLGGAYSDANGVSANGSVVVGTSATANGAYRAYRWINNVMTDLGTLGGLESAAYRVSANGAVVVGEADTNDGVKHAYRWTNNVMTDLGTLGGNSSAAWGASTDGAVVVGHSDITGNASMHAFRWTQAGGMADLGSLGGTYSYAYGVSADGAVVVGEAETAGGAAHAFRWVSGASGGVAGNLQMYDLGTLGGTSSAAYGVSADGTVVVGTSRITGDAVRRAFRWTQAGGMQTVEDWLRAGGVTVPADITKYASAANQDGSVVVGQLANNHAFIARLASAGSGLVTLADVQDSLSGTARGGGMALSVAGTLVNGAHGRPLARRVAAGQQTFWLAGDWGRDDHGSRDGDLGLAEVGLGRNFGPAQINVALGRTWANQNQVLGGHTQVDGTYLLAEALAPLAGNLWGTLGGYVHQGNTDLKRGYMNAGVQDRSTGKPDVDTWSLRARLDLDNAYRLASADFAPYVDLTYSETKLAAYTETGGAFPARFDARKDKATELRLGVNATKPLGDGMTLLGTLEAAHRFEKSGARTSGAVVGLFGFDLAGANNKQDWLRAGIGVEGKVAEGTASLSLNLTTKGEAPSYWLAANWQKAF